MFEALIGNPFSDPRHLCYDTECGGQKYHISTADTFDRGWETMIFRRDERGELDVREVYQELHGDFAEAEERHEYICDHIADFVPAEAN